MRIPIFSCSLEEHSKRAIELLKLKVNISNNIIYDIFQTRKSDCKLRSQTEFASNCVNTRKLRLNSPRYFASKVWNMV